MWRKFINECVSDNRQMQTVFRGAAMYLYIEDAAEMRRTVQG